MIQDKQIKRRKSLREVLEKKAMGGVMVPLTNLRKEKKSKQRKGDTKQRKKAPFNKPKKKIEEETI